ncbi:hypothetical protein GDO86_006201 [Hymenochirus boettgeri]|uniref:Uncharacterized protein n=1 Tax=Hymenochirus boettgeri TaxID=247094 RepID=A0A8T2JA61_9PIPI|nr:hypothetical protein GDO86_006201 [Hymenochirus boettgeri]
MDEMKPDEKKSELILNHVLDIIYMLTGEEYIIEKKNQQLSHLSTGEYLEENKEFYLKKWDSSDIFPARISDNIKTSVSTDFPRMALLAPQSRASNSRKTRVQLPSSIQLRQMMHSIAKLGRKVAKIDRNIAHILKACKAKGSTAARRFPGSHSFTAVENKAPIHITKENMLLKVHRDPVYQNECKPSQLSTIYEPLSHLQTFTGKMCTSQEDSYSTLNTVGSLPINCSQIKNHLEIAEHSQIDHDSIYNVNSVQDTLPERPLLPLPTFGRMLPNDAASDSPADRPSVSTKVLKIKMPPNPQQNSIHGSDARDEAILHIYDSEALPNLSKREKKAELPKTPNVNNPPVKCPAFLIVSKASEQQKMDPEILHSPDTIGDPLPDIQLAKMTSGLLNNFKMQSRGQPHRFAQLLFQHHVPYSLYKTWTHNTNFDGSRGKHALPKNLKRVILNETSAAYKMTPFVLKKIKDTLNALLRIPRVGGWDSSSDHG